MSLRRLFLFLLSFSEGAVWVNFGKAGTFRRDWEQKIHVLSG